MKILITGGAGFIGSHLAAHHLHKKDKVWVVDNLSTGRIEHLDAVHNHPYLRFSQADLNSWHDLDDAVAWADGIYHMAAIVGQKVVLSRPLAVLTENIKSCERLIKSLIRRNKTCPLLIASSSEVYGTKASSFREDADLSFPSGKFNQVNYGLSKYVNETMALSYIHEQGLNCVIARLFNTIGPNQERRYGMVMPRFIEQALMNDPLTVFGEGNQTRSFCDIRDTLSLLDTLMHSPQTKGEIFNVGNDHEISILDLAKLIKKRLNSSSEIVHIPYEKAYGMPYQDTLRRCPDLTKVRKLFSFEPKYSLEDTIDEMARHFDYTKMARIS